MPAVAERVAPQKPPGRQHDAAPRTVGPQRLDRVGGAGRLVLAAARQPRRDEALIQPDGGRQKAAQGSPPSPSCSRSSRALKSVRKASRPPASATAADPLRATTT